MSLQDLIYTYENFSGVRVWPLHWKPCLESVVDMPFECYRQTRLDYHKIGLNLGVHDYITAVQGNVNAGLPGCVPHLEKLAYILKPTGVAYWGNEPSHTPKNTHKQKLKNDMGGLSPRVFLALVGAIDVEGQDNILYESVVAMEAGLITEPGHESLFPPEDVLITAGGNVTMYGCPPALPWGEKECDMPLDCLAALENYFEDLAVDENEYSSITILCVEQAFFGFGDAFEVLGFEQQWDSASDWGQWPLSDERSRPPVDALVFVNKLEEVDIATIAAEDMKCSYCWDDYGHAEDEMVKLRSGEVKADNAPVKMPCGPGHLIGKTCLMQLSDSGIRLCPMCSVDIVALVD